jgi:hypothetical protein
MPIYEYYCPDNHRIYQFYAKTLAQGLTVPRCPDNPKFRMRKLLSPFAVVGQASEGPPPTGEPSQAPGDERMEAAMGAMEREFSGVDENDPKGMGRMMRRMAELTGERIDGEMEEVVRKLEEGADPESFGEQLGDEAAGPGQDAPEGQARQAPHRLRPRRAAPARDPVLYDFP